MSITDELREWGNRWEDAVADEIDAIADRIDAEYKHAIGYVDDRDPETMWENGWVKLPVDADGVPIHVGDTVEEVGENPTWYTVCGVGTLQDRPAVFYGNPSEYGYADGWDFAERVRHVQPDSWERIIEDAGNSDKDGHEWAEYAAALVERCRRLAGEDA